MHLRASTSLGVATTLSVLVVVAAPVLPVVLLFAHHAASYEGMCGPYPTDIPAHPCDLSTYLEGFFEPFAAVGLLVIAVGSAAAAVLVVGAAWALGALGWAARRALVGPAEAPRES